MSRLPRLILCQKEGRKGLCSEEDINDVGSRRRSRFTAKRPCLVSVQPVFDSDVWFYENRPPSLVAYHIHTPIYIQAVVHSAMGHSQHKCGTVYAEHNNADGALHYACDRPSTFATNYRKI